MHQNTAASQNSFLLIDHLSGRKAGRSRTAGRARRNRSCTAMAAESFNLHKIRPISLFCQVKMQRKPAFFHLICSILHHSLTAIVVIILPLASIKDQLILL